MTVESIFSSINVAHYKRNIQAGYNFRRHPIKMFWDLKMDTGSWSWRWRHLGFNHLPSKVHPKKTPAPWYHELTRSIGILVTVYFTATKKCSVTSALCFPPAFESGHVLPCVLVYIITYDTNGLTRAGWNSLWIQLVMFLVIIMMSDETVMAFVFMFSV